MSIMLLVSCAKNFQANKNYYGCRGQLPNNKRLISPGIYTQDRKTVRGPLTTFSLAPEPIPAWPCVPATALLPTGGPAGPAPPPVGRGGCRGSWCHPPWPEIARQPPWMPGGPRRGGTAWGGGVGWHHRSGSSVGSWIVGGSLVVSGHVRGDPAPCV